jgi:hypothetical protein
MSVLLMGGVYDVRSQDGLRWHDIHTKFHEDLVQAFKQHQGFASEIL